MRKTLILLFALSGCVSAPPLVRSHRISDFERAREASIKEAEREFWLTGKCTWRAQQRCGEGSAISYGDGFVGGTQYFDKEGRWIGADEYSCVGGSQSGGQTPPCEPGEVLLCPRALARMKRVGATIGFQKQEHELTQDGALETAAFRATIRFDPDARHSLSLTVTAVSPGVELRAGPLIERYQAESGVAPPAIEPFQVGESFELPASIYVNDSVAPLTVRSHYRSLSNPHPDPLPKGEGAKSRSASAEPAAR